MYEYTDKVIRYLTRQYIRMFGNAKSRLLPMDEINVLRFTKELYADAERITQLNFLRIAQKAYRDAAETEKRKIDKKWLHRYLSEYDPVMLYVYLSEVERKRERLAEAVIAAQNRATEVDKALRYYNRMAKQFAVEITDKAIIDAYKDNGVTKVIWKTVNDERRCRECRERHNKVYDIDKIPPKPHPNCRCILLPYKRED